MPSLFGRSYGADELRRLVGGMSQLAGIRLVELADGRARGMRAVEVWTGSGFRFQVLADRGLDLGAAEHAGRPLAWLHPALGPPALHERAGLGWLRTFGGGLVTTCGLDHFGPPDPEGEGYGLHGRASHLPAESLRLRQEWRGEDYVLEVEGETRQARLFGENLRLERRLSTRLGAASLVLEDRVTNEGYRPASLAVLYHCNFGFPVVSPDSELLVRDRSVAARDDAARDGLSAHLRFGPPQRGFAEQVFFHEPRVDATGRAAAAIVNRAIGFGAFVRWRAAELPVLSHWKMAGEGEYVCGLEPCTHVMAETRREQRERGSLRDLAPGESVSLRLEIGALPDADSVQAFERTQAQ
ncbi:MAG TPA: aldose 1-epimerase family protein [Vicinamibacteria bacterium]|nr:aldose 1-epimerase family protein [Vicinamibacteria bacterium]